MKNIGSMRFQISRNFEQMRIFKKIWRIFDFSEFFKKRKTRKLGNGKALYESSVRKLGWRFTARLPYWCNRKPRPESTEFIWNMNLFEHVSREQNQLHMKMCHMQSVLYVLKFDFVWVWASYDKVHAISIWGQLFCKGSLLWDFYKKIDFQKKTIWFLTIVNFWIFKISFYVN